MRTPDDAMHALQVCGFLSRLGPGDGLVPYTVVFAFAWEAPFLDAVHLRDEHDATAVRARIDNTASLSCLFADDNNDDPSPGEEWWKGAFVEVVGKLLGLKPPSPPGEPTTLVMTPAGLWVPSNRRELVTGIR